MSKREKSCSDQEPTASSERVETRKRAKRTKREAKATAARIGIEVKEKTR